MTKECELLLAIAARQNCGSAYNIAKEIYLKVHQIDKYSSNAPLIPLLKGLGKGGKVTKGNCNYF
jgi:hypothetical protein